MERYLLISSDCHAGLPWEGYRPWVESRYMSAYEEWLADRFAHYDDHKNRRMAFFTQEFIDRYDKRVSEVTGRVVKDMGFEAAVSFTPEDRIRMLEADGVVSEVMFPDVRRNAVPFQGSFVGGPKTRELEDAGKRVYNRWLAEFCSHNPQRSLGLANLGIYDIEQTISEIHWAKKAGLAGINLPTQPGAGGLPLYNTSRYEPLWDACEELDFPVHFHIGGIPGKVSRVSVIGGPDSQWYQHRPVWEMIFGGVFERHPGLRAVMVEQGADWIPDTLTDMDRLFDDPKHKHLREGLPMKPSEYWARNVWVGHSSNQSRWQWEMRYDIGVDRLMWGNDFPHPDALWPFTKERVHEFLGGCPESELRMILGETAAKFYRLDLAKLAPVVERVGLAAADV